MFNNLIRYILPSSKIPRRHIISMAIRHIRNGSVLLPGSERVNGKTWCAGLTYCIHISMREAAVYVRSPNAFSDRFTSLDMCAAYNAAEMIGYMEVI